MLWGARRTKAQCPGCKSCFFQLDSSMPAWLGASCTAACNSACCSPLSAEGNPPTVQMTTPGDHPPQTSRAIGLWCEHPDPGHSLPPSPSISRVKHGAGSGPAATSRVTSPSLVASTPDTSFVVPQSHPNATAQAAYPSPSCPQTTSPKFPCRLPQLSPILPNANAGFTVALVQVRTVPSYLDTDVVSHVAPGASGSCLRVSRCEPLARGRPVPVGRGVPLRQRIRLARESRRRGGCSGRVEGGIK